MAKFSVFGVGHLDRGFILAPERYDPRRVTPTTSSRTQLADLVMFARDQIDSRKAAGSARYLVLDTGDAQEGIIRSWKSPVEGTMIGSSKKRIRSGDVVISRLRPYLRQVAFVDNGLFSEPASSGEVLVSTEFFVLRPKDGASIAFLAPYLLSRLVQELLAASQEGGHHPRFNQQTLERLRIPDRLLLERATISAAVEEAVNAARAADFAFRELVRQIDG